MLESEGLGLGPRNHRRTVHSSHLGSQQFVTDDGGEPPGLQPDTGIHRTQYPDGVEEPVLTLTDHDDLATMQDSETGATAMLSEG